MLRSAFAHRKWAKLNDPNLKFYLHSNELHRRFWHYIFLKVARLAQSDSLNHDCLQSLKFAYAVQVDVHRQEIDKVVFVPAN